MEANCRLKRLIHPMRSDVRELLESRGLINANNARPDYQRNDYLRWFISAKRPETRLRRIEQMLDVLGKGDVSMNMAWRPR